MIRTVTARDPASDLFDDADTRVRVVLPLPVAGPFDYRAPAGLGLAPGDWVRVPFGPQQLRGVVWSLPAGPTCDDLPMEKLRPVTERLAAPPLSADIRSFVDWVADYTLFPVGSILRMVMRTGDGLTAPRGLTVFRTTEPRHADLRLTAQRRKVLAVCANRALTHGEIAEATAVSAGVVQGLAKSGALTVETRDPDPPFPLPDPEANPAQLSAEQAQARAHLLDAMADDPKPVLLDGVTGSGKTEVYLEAVRAVLTQDPDAQILIMLPEIGLTLPFLERIEKRFGAAPAAWHSDIRPAARRRVWRRVLEGQSRLVVGARSALFLPFKKLRLIIVDEEHDAAYKQEDGVLYQARDMAVARGTLGRFPVILASATPSLETVINAADGRYRSVTLSSRYGPAHLPDIRLVDMRDTPPTAPQSGASGPVWLSPVLVEAVSESLVAGEQALLFLNRRGYAPLTLCRKCGHRMVSPHSDTCLVEHRFESRLVCHHTGYSIPKPTACPACNAVGSLTACGPGVERIADEAAARWPHARIEILSSDRSQSGNQKTILAAMQAGDIDILVATQAAAKGHNFPNLTCVGVVDADMGLQGADLRAAERTFQVLSQVSGRAGRAEKPGRAFLQTYNPDAPVLKALVDGDRDRFLAIEAQGRHAMTFPPFGRLAAIVLSARDETLVRQAADTLRQCAPVAEGVEVWGPAPAPIFKLNGQSRIRFLLRSKRKVNLQAYLRDWVSGVKLPGAVRTVIDIDPYTFL